MKNPYLEIVF